MKKLSNTETELKKSVAYKKVYKSNENTHHTIQYNTIQYNNTKQYNKNAG